MKQKRVTISMIAVAAILSFVSLAGTPMAQQELANPRIIVLKKARKLKLYDGQRLVKTYDMVLGFAPTGDKQVEGDGRTPEGDFYVFVKNDKSNFTVSLGVSYPSVDDADRGVNDRLITQDEAKDIRSAIQTKAMPPQKTKLGGEIYIHGGGTANDWTWGCIALNDEDIRELFSFARTGMPVSIRP